MIQSYYQMEVSYGIFIIDMPGIGKTTFLFYLLYCLYKEKCDYFIIVDCYIVFVYIRSDNIVMVESRKHLSFKNEFAKTNTIYIYDAQKWT